MHTATQAYAGTGSVTLEALLDMTPEELFALPLRAGSRT